MQEPKRRNPTPPLTKNEIPKLDRRLMILHICRRLGIEAKYLPKGAEREVRITEANYQEFTNLDFLLTNKPALARLYTLKVIDDGASV